MTFIQDGFNVVIGSLDKISDELMQLSVEDSRINILTPKDSLFELVRQSDYAFGAGGVSMLERISQKLPASVITLSDNQIECAQQLSQMNCIHYIGHYTQIHNTYLEDVLSQFPFFLQKIVVDSSICDGHGSNRVSEILIGNKQI